MKTVEKKNKKMHSWQCVDVGRNQLPTNSYLETVRF